METEFSLSKFLSALESAEDPIPEPWYGEETGEPITESGT